MTETSTLAVPMEQILVYHDNYYNPMLLIVAINIPILILNKSMSPVPEVKRSYIKVQL